MNGDSEPATTRRLEAPHRRAGSAPRVVEKAAVVSYRATAWLLGHLPAGPAAAVIGRLVQLSYLLWPAKRRAANANYGHVLGLDPNDPAVRRLALKAYQNYARYLVELMRLPRLTPEAASDGLVSDGLDEIERLWRESSGLIFAAGHVGNNEAMAAGIGGRGWPLSAVADDSSFPEMFKLLQEQRGRQGARIIPWRNLREVYTVLRRREMLALLIDWGYRSDGIPVRLCDAWTTLPAGPATLAAKTGAIILPVVARRLPDGRFHARIDAPIRVASNQPAELLRGTQAVADALTEAIRTAPEQWYNFKPMWPSTQAEMDALERRAAAMTATSAATS